MPRHAHPYRPPTFPLTRAAVGGPGPRSWAVGADAPASLRLRALGLAAAVLATSMALANVRASGATTEIAFRAAAATANEGSSTSLTIAKPSGTASGDVLLAAVYLRSDSALTAPSGWTKLRQDSRGSIYHRVAGSSEPASYTWTWTGGNRSAAGAILAYGGADGASPIAVHSGASLDSSSITAPSVTTSVEKVMVVGFYGIARRTSIAAPAGSTDRVELAASGGKAISFAVADFVQSAAGSTGDKVAIAGASGTNAGQLVGLTPAPPTQPPTSLIATPMDSASVLLQWTAPFGTSRIQVYREGRLLDDFPASLAPSYMDQGLWQSSTYDYEVRTLDGSGVLLQSLAAKATTPGQTGAFPVLFSTTSFWNQRIPADPVLDPNSAAMVSRALVGYAFASNLGSDDSWGIPIAYANLSTELYAVGCTRYDCSTPVSGRIPRYAQPSTGSDHHLGVIDPSSGAELDMWLGAYDPATDTWSAGSRYLPSLSGPGANCASGQHCNGAVAAGFAVTAGIVRPEEIAQGHIDHALAITTPYTRANFIACPAVHEDGKHDDAAALPEGALIQLDPSFDVDAQSWPTWLKVIAHAFQEYGAYVVDTGGSVSLHAESNLDRGYDAWGKVGVTGMMNMAQLPWARFRVLKITQC